MRLDELQTIESGSWVGMSEDIFPVDSQAASSSSSSPAPLAESAILNRDTTGSGTPTAGTTTTEADVAKKIAVLQKQLDQTGSPLHFSLVQASGGVAVEVKDRQSNKVLMRIPPEGVLRVASNGKFEIGTLFDKRY